jgi:hypothetical protein
MASPAPRGNTTFILILLASLTLSLFSVIYPIYVIRPFRHQGARELAIALAVARFRPVLTLVTAVVAILAVIGHWRAQPLRWKRAFAFAGAALAIVFAVLGRVNVFELMFHPIARPTFSAARDVKLDGAEKVIAIRTAGESRAYPVRIISYHHLVNDWVGGTAVVATY